MNIELNEQQATWLEEELNIMINEDASGKQPRSQFSLNTMRSLLAKLKENNEDN